MGSCVDAHNQECVSIGGGVMGCVREALFTAFVGVKLRNAPLDVQEWLVMHVFSRSKSLLAVPEAHDIWADVVLK